MENSETFWQKIKKFFDTASWILLFLFAPYTILIFLSQNAGPGDLLYPFKRGLEGMILIASSVSPTTKAFFRSDLAERRFSEAEKLLIAKTDTGGLDTFVYEMYEVQKEVASLSDQTKKTELTQKVIAQIDQYQARLERVEERVQTSSSRPVADQNKTSQKIQQDEIRPQPSSKPVSQSSPQPPKQDRSLQTFSPTPSPPPPPPPNPIIDDIDKVQDELDKIKNILQTQVDLPPSPTPTPTIEPQIERERHVPDERRGLQEGRQDERREDKDERRQEGNDNDRRGHN